MRRLLLATLLVSAAAIGYEILLMRVLSIVQWHHFAYMILSLALLGYGASGTAIAVLRPLLEPRFEAAFAASALLFSVSMPACFMLGQRVPFNALEIVWNPGQLVGLSLIYLVFFVPFFFAACCIGLAFTCRRQSISGIYFADLVGASLGAMLVVGALFVLIPQNALILLVALALAASLLVATQARARARPALFILLLGWAALLAAGLPQQRLGLHLSDYKGLSQALQVIDSRAIAIRSSPLGLLTVVESPTVPFRHAPGLSFNAAQIPPEQLGVFVDGDSMSVITRLGDGVGSHGYLAHMTAALPYALLESPDVLVLGAGAGQDVLLALHNGARQVHAVELDPEMVALVREDYADFAGGIYDDPRVTLHVAEARSFVGRSERRFDLIHVGLIDSFGASGAGVQALNESYLYTVEAIEEYLARLDDGGMLSVTRWIKLPPRDGLKLVATAIAALERSGVAEPGRRLAMIRSWNTSTLLVRNGEFGRDEISRLREFARSRSFDTAYYPGMPAGEANRYNLLARPWYFDGITALLGTDSADFRERYKFAIDPATDDRPYFFHFFKWRTLPEVVSLRRQGGAGLIEWGYLVLVATLVQAIVAGALLVLLPLSRMRRNWAAATGRRMGAFFFLLGLAFLFVEIAFIQKLILFLGHPLYSVSVVLAGFLAFAGLGSGFTGRLSGVSLSVAVTRAVGTIAVLTIGYVLFLPTLFDVFIGFGDAVRILVSVLLIAPLAFCMGMPFPLGLRVLAEQAPGFIPWAWGINGFASVISASLATLLAIELGFGFVILLALLLYVGAALLLGTLPASGSRESA